MKKNIVRDVERLTVTAQIVFAWIVRDAIVVALGNDRSRE
jgi:hypothetical protein